MPIELYVIFGLAAIAFGIGLMRAYEAVGETQRRVAKVIKTKKGQVERLRRAGRNSLNLKRAIRDAKKRKEMTRMEVEEAEETRSAAEAIDHRLFVLDDRRTKVDQSWIATMAHPDLAEINRNTLPQAIQSWQAGRRFLVFALDAQKARDKALARYPERLGYRLDSVAPQIHGSAKHQGGAS